MKNLFSFKNQVKSISLLIVLILFYSAITQAQSSNQFFNQNQFDPRTDFPLVFVNGQAIPRQQPAVPVWENIQSFVVDQPVGRGVFAKPVTIDLDQVRNGSADSRLEPPNWVNGNAGASNAHYVEGYSIPYRLVIENLVGTGLRSVDIEWDTRHSSSNAIDFITNFDLIDFPAGSHVFNFAHSQETINPLSPEGFIVTDGNPTSPNIPMPANLVTLAQNTFTAIRNAGKGKFGIWGANITPVTGSPTGLRYITEQALTGAQSSTRLRIYFTNTGPTVIISWGGHIAKGTDWGAGNSASAVSGSPYHTRTIEWDPEGNDDDPESLGNQDRSLSAEAVLDPPVCTLGDPTSIECSTSNTFTSGVAASDLPNDVTFAWSVISNTCGSAPTLTNATVGSVTVNAPSGSACGCTFSLRYALIKNNLVVSQCVKLFTVTDTHAPGFTSTPTGSDLGCNPTGLPAPVNPSATDNCGTPTVTSSNGPITSNGCSRSQTRTYTATDACSNTATVGQTFTWVADVTGPTFTSCPAGSDLGCNPGSIPEAGTATATDACGTPSITSSLGAEVGTSCSRSRTRTYTARDACGNTSTCQQVFTYTVDITAPTFTFCPPGSNVGCNPTSFPEPGAATATDACGIPSITSSLGAEVGTSCSRSRTRTYVATDACGNSSTCQQTFTYTVDITAPTFTFCPPGSNVGCNPTSFPEPGAATATDACGTPSITSSLGAEVGTGCSRSRTRTYVATDACGNSSTCQQTFTYTVDVTPPVFTACLPDVTVECGDPTSTAALGSATATDACGSTTVTATDGTPTQVGCQTVIVRTWRARDACSNTATCVQRILVIDTRAPVITCNPVNGSATATDCGSYYLYQNGTKWTAIDGSGNISTANCTVQGGARIMSSPVTAEQKEQTATTVTEEKAKAKTITKAPVIANDVKVNAVPNPFNDRVKFVVNSPQAGYGTLEVMNMLGQKVKTVYQGHINAGTQSFEMVLPGGRNASLFYILRMNGKVVTGKLVQAGVINK